MAIPKSVRQRMINVMYIVLLALLALQIPKEVTAAFLKIDKGIVQSNTSLDAINEANIKGLEKKGAEGDDDATKYAEKSREVQKKSAELSSYINQIKENLIDYTGRDDETGEIENPEEVHRTNTMMLVGMTAEGKEDSDGIPNGKAYELKTKVDETRTAMLDLIPQEDLDEGVYENIQEALTLSTETENGEDWAIETFDHMPAAGVLAMLSQIQADAKTSENKIIDELKKLVGLERVEFDQFKAEIVAPSSYVLRGKPFEARLFLAASSSDNSNISIYANGARLNIDDKGVATYKGNTGSVGEKKITGYISVTNKKGEETKFDFEPYTYTVASPFAVVSPSKMNVFYIGVDNPVEVSAAGASAGDLRVSMSGGDISGSGGNYNVRVTKQGKASVNVTAAGENYGNFEFRVKRIPDPVAKVAGKAGGNIQAGELKVQKGIAAVLEGFDFDAKFNVVSYDLVYAAKRQDLAVARGNGASFNAQMKGYLGKAKPGDLYYFENVKVRGPDGQTRPIPGITFRVR
ncbi:MAG: gliding motility protein GldM [Bacteroidetes bacterium]|nr:gliding motility protein GldM [Bacteroidota bacterium]